MDAGRGRQAAQLLQRVAADPRPIRQGHADQKGTFEMDGQFVARCVESHVGCCSS